MVPTIPAGIGQVDTPIEKKRTSFSFQLLANAKSLPHSTTLTKVDTSGQIAIIYSDEFTECRLLG